MPLSSLDASIALAVALLLAGPAAGRPGAAPAPSQDRGQEREQDPFVDRVETLPLTRELDARGNLGGVTVDRLGFVYVANFRDAVWRISPEGEVETLTRSLYGASGNAVDSRGDLYQANFLSRITADGAVERFSESERFSSHPVRGAEDTVAEMVALGYRLLSGRRIPEGLAVFRLNAEAHPDSPAAQYHQGEAFRYTGQTERAIERCRRVLELDPGHGLAASRLRQLRGDA